MDTETSNIDSQIQSLLAELNFSEAEKSQILGRLSRLNDKEKQDLLTSLENVKAWKVQVEIDEKLLDLEEKYPELMEKAKHEIMQILTEERKATDEEKAQDLLKKIEEMAQSQK